MRWRTSKWRLCKRFCWWPRKAVTIEDGLYVHHKVWLEFVWRIEQYRHGSWISHPLHTWINQTDAEEDFKKEAGTRGLFEMV